jgi:RHS repeat-associated protein
MLISPVGFESLARADTLYSGLETTDWHSGDRTIQYSYDENGSVASKTTIETSDPNNILETVTYEYNLQNRLESVTVDGTTTTYKYNPDGIRVEKTVAGTTTRYLIDSYNHTGYAQVLEEWDTTSTPTLIKTYTISDDVITQATSTSIEHLLYDGHGSTRQLVNTSEDITAAYSYDAYGVMLGGNPGTPQNPGSPATNLLYAGEQFDVDAQQYYLRARYYNQNNGRFNRMDPFSGSQQDPQSLHKYIYGHNDPVNQIDPDGNRSLAETLTVTAIVAIVIGALAPAIIAAYQTAKTGASWRAIGTNAAIAWMIAFGIGIGFALAAPYIFAGLTTVLTLIPGVTVGAVKLALVVAFAALTFYGAWELWYSDAPLEVKISVTAILALAAVVALGQDGIKRIASRAKEHVQHLRNGPPAKRVPNPWGKTGDPRHQGRVNEIETRFTEKKWKTFSGGSKPEQRVYMPDGSYRYPDLVMEKGDARIAFQVGEATQKGLPAWRERPALTDLRNYGEFAHVFFIKK